MARRSTNLTIRLDAATAARLEARHRRGGESKARLAQQFIAEGLEIEEHPGIVFRDGPGGRRPGLAGGPDVWQVVAVIKGSGKKRDAAIRHAAEWLDLAPVQVRAAVGYYGRHQQAIDEWIRRNDEQAEAAEAAWRREQELLA